VVVRVDVKDAKESVMELVVMAVNQDVNKFVPKLAKMDVQHV
jgi:hypothetical protein